jgi:hypothetical protein
MTWAAPPVLDLAPLGQYGAIGVGIVALGIFAFRAYSREVERADRLETRLLDVYQVVQDRVIPTLQDSTRTVQETTEFVRRVMTEYEVQNRIRRATEENNRGR